MNILLAFLLYILCIIGVVGYFSYALWVFQVREKYCNKHNLGGFINRIGGVSLGAAPAIILLYIFR